ncbi:hypothetical protein Taro_019895 [Colocasia esculenta]|uniref:Uncharacterized protein n=1 Tax=Colocasia esculenta TaxID=4460 RepID=A0A843UXG5_COLES|nr:hypothetical protein [Colocasia esculenta]
MTTPSSDMSWMKSWQSSIKKPTSWNKPQCGSARLKPPSRFYTGYNPSAGQKSFLEKKEQN